MMIEKMSQCGLCHAYTNLMCEMTRVPFCSKKCQAKYIGNRTHAMQYFENRNQGNVENLSSIMDLKSLYQKLKSGEYTIKLAAKAQGGMRLDDFLVFPCSQMNFLEALARDNFLAKGTYGSVSKAFVNGNDDLIVKQVIFDPKKDNAFDGVHVETRLLQLFSEDFLLTGACPHVPVFLGNAQCAKDDYFLNFNITTRAEYGTLHRYLSNKDWFESAKLLEDTVRQFIFEMTYTFAVIQQQYPRFVHCDVKLNNVLAIIAPGTGHSRYVIDDNMSFDIPNSGVRSMLWDFDFASIVGVLDNEKLNEFHNMSPAIGRSPLNDQGVDLFVFVLWIVHSAMKSSLRNFNQSISNSLIQQIMEVWEIEDWTFGTDAYKWIKEANIKCKSPLEILKTSSLFDVYRQQQQDEPTDTYRMDLAATRDRVGWLRVFNFPTGGNEVFPNTNVPLWFGSKKDAFPLVSTLVYPMLFVQDPTKERRRRNQNDVLQILAEWFQELQDTATANDARLPPADNSRVRRSVRVLKRILDVFPDMNAGWYQLLGLFAYYYAPPRYPMNYDFFCYITADLYTIQEVRMAAIQWVWMEAFILNQ